ncbi:Hypoxanthine phosphoribosyl transferase [Syntrophomonas zehnderi OL-4]|uniref:Hypoxanthine phosphoribosyltransferase n=1 Tax=Syntrophomonas zehnderi OL-4 TaxID=690567 RepID=A0A0E4GBT5_9FIRM|nr:Hypoxanthine phosphoribosyl transferase [Syntrophomonas zehnderi OL-4]
MNLDEITVLYTAEEIQEKVCEMGRAISFDYEGESLLVVGILKGAFIFMADLVRQIKLPLQLDFIDVSSYGNSTVSSGEVRIMKDLEYSIKGKNVLIVEDIVDSGLTLYYITEILKKRSPQSVRIACLLDKPSRRKSPAYPDYVGFTIPDEFIVGYGLDYDEKYREYPDICILKPSVYEK